MTIINQTFIVEEDVLQQWLEWIKQEYIPDALNSGMFTAFKILKVTTPSIDPGNTFALQLTVHENILASGLETSYFVKKDAMTQIKFGEKVLFFRTLLEELL